MQWWTEFLNWLASSNGERIVTTAIVPFVAIVMAGIVAALIGRASARKVIELSERAVRTSAVTALISAARKAAVWNSLAAPEQQHVDHLISDADIRLRLLPVAGTSMAADWAAHEIASMKRNAVSFSFQAEQSLLIFRDRLVEWQSRPGRAKKLFKNDLEAWAYDSSVTEQELVHQQQAWAASQVSESTGKVTTPARSMDTQATTGATAGATAVATTAATSPMGTAASPPVAGPVAAPTAAPAATLVSAPVAAPVAAPAAAPVNAPVSTPANAAMKAPADDPGEPPARDGSQKSSVFPLADLIEPERASTRNNHPVVADGDDDSGDEPTSYLAFSEDERGDDDLRGTTADRPAEHSRVHVNGRATAEPVAGSIRRDEEHSAAKGSDADDPTNTSVVDAVSDSADASATDAEDDASASAQHGAHDEGR